jgi:hypothetical protein
LFALNVFFELVVETRGASVDLNRNHSAGVRSQATAVSKHRIESNENVRGHETRDLPRTSEQRGTAGENL